MLLLRDADVRAATASDDVLPRMEAMLSRPVDGGLELPGRLTIDATRAKGWLRLMPVIAYDVGYAGYKAMNFHPDHGVRYVISLISLETGEVVALLDADWITAYRTAATSAIAARHLARPHAECVTVIGSGTQARALLEATAEVMTPRRVVVHSPTRENRERFAAEMGERLGLTIEAEEERDRALACGDVVLSAFRAGGSPVIQADALAPGAVVCGISSVRPEHREVDVSVWEASRVVVDDLAHVWESGDGRAAAEAGLDATQEAVELWQVLRDPALGRRSDDERVLFKSVGTAEQDVALAAIALERAVARGLGQELEDFPSLRPIQSRVTTTAR